MADESAARDPIFDLSSDLVDAYAAACPVQATMAGVDGAFDGWDDYSPEGGERVRSLLAGFRERLAALPPQRDASGGLARRVMADFLDEKIEIYEHDEHLRDLNNIESPLQYTRIVFDLMDTSVEGGWEAVARRLETLGDALSGYARALDEGSRRGLTPARRQVLAALAQARTHAAEGASLRTILQTYEESPRANAPLRARLGAAVRAAEQAYASFAAFLEEFAPRASPRDAFGPERYARAARRFLGTDIDPIETYHWGFREIARIESSMDEVARSIAPGARASTVVRELQESPAQIVTDVRAFLSLMRERQEKALSELTSRHFDVPEPIRTLEVKLAPEGGPIGAYYVPPSDGFTRPGTIYYSPGREKRFTLFSEITTAYHEGFPGHHLQCGLQVYLADTLSRLHRLFAMRSGYAEGWALYAERLMHELGYLERPEFVLGMQMAQLFRAVRVVADIGMHLELPIPESFDFRPGEVWTWEHCVELLTTRAFAKRAHAESEATRYLGWPGQAISYKVGERKLLELRDEVRAMLGPRFDLRAFHKAVLATGSIGLDHLREVVRAELAP
jgi:uncharacterized protein (DUF885 family)